MKNVPEGIRSSQNQRHKTEVKTEWLVDMEKDGKMLGVKLLREKRENSGRKLE